MSLDPLASELFGRRLVGVDIITPQEVYLKIWRLAQARNLVTPFFLGSFQCACTAFAILPLLQSRCRVSRTGPRQSIVAAAGRLATMACAIGVRD